LRRAMGMKQQAEQLPAVAVHSSSPSRCSSTCAGSEVRQTGAAPSRTHPLLVSTVGAKAGGGRHSHTFTLSNHMQHGVLPALGHPHVPAPKKSVTKINHRTKFPDAC
jgi:hypothetical protein